MRHHPRKLARGTLVRLVPYEFVYACTFWLSMVAVSIRVPCVAASLCTVLPPGAIRVHWASADTSTQQTSDSKLRLKAQMAALGLIQVATMAQPYPSEEASACCWRSWQRMEMN